MSYRPQPIDVCGIELRSELTVLTERLAQDAHDRWAETRIAQGWTYGDARDDTRKLHPCLIPYDQLPESEKDLDRADVVATLKTMLALHYRVVSPAG